MRFIKTGEFYESHKMGSAAASETRLTRLLGEGEGEQDKSENSWTGLLVLEDGSNVKVACWDWKGGMRCGMGVSIWCEREEIVPVWRKFLEMHPLT